ncbi:hypothetical protein [Micromonospora sp. CA-248212]|uniref:hypothetical protein n=1 Tax=Micromonospora sp. CA-248212 TaxID=3239961 RepID=UPI003D90C31B
MTAPALAAPTLPVPQPAPDVPFPHPMPPPNQQATCPTCGNPVASLLAACWKPACLTADADYDAAIDARSDA